MAAILETLRPGDVISSDLLNRMIALLNQHDAMITAGPAGGGSGVTVSRFIPDPPFQAGQDLQILGSNFGFTSGSTVLKFDDLQVNAFRLGSSDASLLVNVPFLSGLGAGRDVLMSLSNGTSTATRTVRVLPMQQPQQGNVDVLPNDAVTPNPNPNPILSGQPVTLAYLIRSRALLPASFAIGVQCSDAAMQAAAQVLNASQVPIASRQIDLAPNQQLGVFIRFPVVTVANGASFTVTVSASTPGAAGSDTRTFTVNSTVTPPDPTIGLAFNALTAVDPNTGNPDTTASYSASDNTVHLRQDSIGRVNLFATFTRTGTYDVTVQALPPTASWTVVRAGTPAQYIISAADLSAGGGTTSRNPEIGIQAQAGASTTGQVRLTLQRTGATERREFTFNLALGA